jgi:hypothetical protein
MLWTHQPYLPTISGFDIALWAAAYVAWRYLANLGRVRHSVVAATPARAPQVMRAPAPQFVPGRWSQRAAMLEKMGVVVPRQVEMPKRLRRAA